MTFTLLASDPEQTWYEVTLSGEIIISTSKIYARLIKSSLYFLFCFHISLVSELLKMSFGMFYNLSGIE